MAENLQSAKRSVARQIKATESEIEEFFARLERFMNVNLEEILEGLVDGEFKAIEAARALGGLQQALQEAGLYAQLGRIEAIYGRELSRIKEEFGKFSGKDIAFSNVDFEITEALISFDISALSNRIDLYIDDIRSVLMRNVIAGQTPDLKQLQDKLGSRTFSELKTELNTGLQAFNRSVNQRKAEELGLKLFLYVGPDDDVTRPFCEERVGQVFTQEEIDSWDNGQGLPANVYLGGYNCRHHLRPVSEELARDLGYDG